MIKYVLDKIVINEEHRVVVPCLWDENVLDKLPNNYWIAKKLLDSVHSKFKNKKEQLEQYDGVIKQQIRDGILAESDSNIDALRASPEVSFVAHNAVFRPGATSTKCRVVLLSNLCEKKPQGSLSHNQVSIPGPQLNNKIVTTCTLYRFNKYLLIYDLEKAFLQLALQPSDSAKLHILWFKDVQNGDFSLVPYYFQRLPFGMRFSPFLLMISLYYILIVNKSEITDDMSDMLFNLCYMDNLAFSSNDVTKMIDAYKTSFKIFNKYSFNLQQFVSNCPELSKFLNSECLNSETNEHKLFGMSWNSSSDTISPMTSYLNPDACTKREILSTTNSNYDPLGILLPTLNRAKLFLNGLQLDKGLGWDETINDVLKKEWRNIALQMNSSTHICIPRFIGGYESEYTLIAFVDASKDFFGCVLFIQSNSEPDQNKNFLISKNRLINQQMKSKTIPVLELLALRFGLQTALDMKKELSNAFIPLKVTKIKVYSDSMITLEWLSSKFYKTAKVEKRGSKVNNPLESIMKLCTNESVDFFHIKGIINPADCATRCVSKKLLVQSNFHSGPKIDSLEKPFVSYPPIHSPRSRIPTGNVDLNSQSQCSTLSAEISNCPVNINKYSSFARAAKVLHFVRKFIKILKSRMANRFPLMYDPSDHEPCRYTDSVKELLKLHQRDCYGDVINFFTDKNAVDVPIISQLNLFLDDDGLIKVQSKMRKMRSDSYERYPVLMHKKSPLTTALIMDYHHKLLYAGTYRTLAELNKEFYIPSAYSTVKNVIKNCLICRKVNNRCMKVKTNDHRPFRVNPSEFPFREIACDHIGPFRVKGVEGERKVYILIITCFYTRGVNLLVSPKIDAESFLLALQSHIFEFGCPQSIVSDNGSPIVSSINLIHKYLDEPIVKDFLTENGISNLSFQPYPAKASFLGGFVENLVKQVKKMIHSSLGKLVLTYEHFELLVKECRMLMNKRPVACKRVLSDQSSHETFDALTPEMLIYGHEIPTIMVIPHLDSEHACSFSPHSHNDLFDKFDALRKAKHALEHRYHGEFIENMRYLGTNEKSRYDTKNAPKLNLNDLVTIRQDLCKPYNYPLGLITDIEYNDLNDPTAATIRKANGELVRRHISDLILLEKTSIEPVSQNHQNVEEVASSSRPSRGAAVASRNKTNLMFEQNLA